MKKDGNNSIYGWQYLGGFALVFTLPFVFLVGGIWEVNFKTLHSLFESVFLDYLSNTFLISIFVLFFTVIIGASTAWVVSQYYFPFRSIIQFLLPLSIVISPYTLSIIFLEYANLASSYVIPYVYQNYPQWSQLVIKYFNFPFLIAVLVLCFYPYVYVFAKAAYERNSRSIIDMARVLTRKRQSLFFKIGFPVSKIAIICGASLVFMDVINEYASVSYFGFNTISSAVYRLWFSYNDFASARFVSLLLLIFVLIIIWFSQNKVYKRNYGMAYHIPHNKRKLSFIYSIGAFIYCSIPVVLGVIFPIAQLSYWASFTFKRSVTIVEYAPIIINTTILVIITTSIGLLLAIGISYIHHLNKHSKFSSFTYKIMTFGYAIPGTVVAIAVIGLFYFIQKYVFNSQDGLISFLIGKTIFVLVFAFIIKLFFVMTGPIYTGFHSYGQIHEMSARSLGAGIWRTFFKISLPQNMPFIVSGVLFFVIEILKEIPITLALRPFNFDTLAIKTYLLARDEMYIQASIPALMSIIIGLLCMSILELSKKKRRVSY